MDRGVGTDIVALSQLVEPNFCFSASSFEGKTNSKSEKKKKEKKKKEKKKMKKKKKKEGRRV